VAFFHGVRRLYECLELQFTAPGATRPSYAEFLDEAAPVVGGASTANPNSSTNSLTVPNCTRIHSPQAGYCLAVYSHRLLEAARDSARAWYGGVLSTS